MSATPPESPRVRRAPTRPSFDPKTQPWVPSSLKFGAVPETHLNPEWLRAVLSKNIERQLDIPNESLRRMPGREGTPVEASVLVPIVMRPEGLAVL